MALPACSGGNDNDCNYPACEQMLATGPQINISPKGAAIAAIETLGGCSVSWSGLAAGLARAEPVCPSLPADAGLSADVCANRYLCQSRYGFPYDAGFTCTEAWIDMGGDRCGVTVISETNERQTFDVAVTSRALASHCSTSMGQCVEMWSVSTEPPQITVSFGTRSGETPVTDGGNAEE